MFSVDYPFSNSEMGVQFFNSLELAGGEIEKFAHINADKLLKL